MKSLFFTFSILFTVISASAQDLIILKNGDEIQSKVTEILPTEIKYKRFDHQDGPTITISKADVFMIKYENGMKEVINTAETSNADKPVENRIQNKMENGNPNKNTETDLPTSRLICKYEGKKGLINSPIRLYWDTGKIKAGILKSKPAGIEIGRGGFITGFEAETEATVGEHGILLLQGNEGSGRMVWSGTINIKEPNKTIIAVFKYSKMLGMMWLDHFEEQ